MGLPGLAQTMQPTAFDPFWALVRGTLRLDEATFQLIHTLPLSLLAALLVVLLAGLSQAVGQSVVLFINQVRPLRFVFSLLLSTVLFVFGYSFWALSTWVIVHFIFAGDATLIEVIRTLGFSYAPLIFSALMVFPYLGMPIFVVLSIWSLWAIVVGIDAITALDRWQTFTSTALGWAVLQLLQRTVGQPIVTLGRWLTNQVAGGRLIRDRSRLSQLLQAGLTAPDPALTMLQPESESEEL